MTAGEAADVQAKWFERHWFLLQGIAVSFVKYPCITNTEIQNVPKQPHVPPPGTHGGLVQMDKHVGLVDASHLTIVLLDDIWAGNIHLLLGSFAKSLYILEGLHSCISKSG